MYSASKKFILSNLIFFVLISVTSCSFPKEASIVFIDINQNTLSNNDVLDFEIRDKEIYFYTIPDLDYTLSNFPFELPIDLFQISSSKQQELLIRDIENVFPVLIYANFDFINLASMGIAVQGLSRPLLIMQIIDAERIIESKEIEQLTQFIHSNFLGLSIEDITVVQQ